MNTKWCITNVERKFLLVTFFALFVVICTIITNNIFGGRDYVYTQDTFLIMKPPADPFQSFYIWKPNRAPGEAFLEYGYFPYHFYTWILYNSQIPLNYVEYSFIFIMVLFTQMSFFYVVYRIFRPGSLVEYAFVFLSTSLYTMNAYNFTVTFYLIENWTAYAIILPLVFLLIYNLATGQKKQTLLKDSLILIIISQLFMYGHQGPFFIASLIISFLMLLLAKIIYKFNFLKLFKKIAILLVFLFIAASMWIVNNEYTLKLALWKGSTHILENNNLLLEHMVRESSTTSILNVLSFTGFVWLDMPYLFPWYSNYITRVIQIILSISGWCFIASIYVLTNQNLRTDENSKNLSRLFMLLLGVIPMLIFIMKTLQPPFGEVLYHLVITHFPGFYVFINPYYFFGQWLVLLYSMFFILASMFIIKSKLSHKTKKSLTAMILMLIIFNTSFWSIILIQGKVSASPNSEDNWMNLSNSANIPQELMQLNDLFTNKPYKAVMIPPYFPEGYGYWIFDNVTITDTGTFVYSLIDIPTFVYNNEETFFVPSRVSEFILRNETYHLIALLKYYGIKYIILNGYLHPQHYEQYGIKNSEELEDALENLHSFGKIFESNNAKFVVYEYLGNVYPEVYVPSIFIKGFESNMRSGHILEEFASEANVFESNLLSYLINISNVSIDMTNSSSQNSTAYSRNYGIFPYLENLKVNTAVSVNANESRIFECMRVDGEDNATLLYAELSFSEKENTAWKNIILGFNNSEVVIQISTDYQENSSVLSLQYHPIRGSKIAKWTNVPLPVNRSLQGSCKMLIAITPLGIDTYLLNDGSHGSLMGVLPFGGRITQSNNFTVSVFFVNSVANVTFKIIEDPDLTISRNAEVSDFSMINPTLWRVRVNATEPFMLSFTQSYNPLWIAHVNGIEIRPIPLYSGMTGFWINQTGQLEITIEYQPQRWFFYGSIISVATLLACLIYLTYNCTKNKAFWKRIETILHTR